MRFIELNDVVDCAPVLLNIYNIVTISKIGTGSRIVTIDGTILVSESPDEIKIKIHG